MKKTLSLLLIFVMISSLLPLSAFAEAEVTDEIIEETAEETAVEPTEESTKETIKETTEKPTDATTEEIVVDSMEATETEMSLEKKSAIEETDIPLDGARDETYSGICGNKLTWTLDSGTLTISGTGAMWDYTNTDTASWNTYIRKITAIVIDDSVTSIGDYAFYYCAKAKNIIIGDSVKSIGDYAFDWCTALERVAIPDSVTSIGSSAFNYCTKLTGVTIGGKVTSIGEYAFRGCDSLLDITIPASVTSIGYCAFVSCDSLTGINVNKSNKSYASEDGVLFNKNKTALIRCPGGFSGSYTILSSVTSIEDFAFCACETLSTITLPASITNIGICAFDYCDSLTNINVNQNNKTYASKDGVLFSKDMSTLIRCPGGFSGSYTIPSGVTSIGGDAFYGCKSLTSIMIPNGVTNIRGSAFFACYGLKSIAFPDSVTSIGDWAFSNCKALESVIFNEGVTSIANGAFFSCPALTDVYYAGTEEQKNAISIGNSNSDLMDAVWHYNSTGHEHIWDSGVVTTPPTDTEIGVKTYTCSKCGETKTEEIPAIPGTPIDSAIITIGTTVDDDVVVTITVDGKELVDGTDYTFTSTTSDDGTVSVTITGCGEHIGTTTVTLDHTPGDMDGKDGVTILDVLTLLKAVAGIIDEPAHSDVNGDGEVTILDVLHLLKYVAGINGTTIY